MPDVLTADELQDWLALYEVDPWGEHRADLRSAVGAVAVFGGFRELQPEYPYVPPDNEDISAEDEAELMETLREMNNGTAGTAESETDRVG